MTTAELAPQAPLRRTLELARPIWRRLLGAALLGAAAVGASVGLLATSGWLISTAAQHPNVQALGVAVVGVRFFGLTRGVFRYAERLVGHDAAFRVLGTLRVTVYTKLERLAPDGLPAFRSGDLLARLVGDVDGLQDLMVRVLPAYAVAVLAGGGAVLLVGFMLPSAGLVLLVALVVAATLVPWLTKTAARRAEASVATLRGELSTAVVDLVDGAPDLIAYGAAPAQLARTSEIDAELTARAGAAASTAGLGAGLSLLLGGLAVWGVLLLGVPAVHTGLLDGVLLAVIVLTPLAAFEAVAGLPAAAQALEQVRRCAGRVFEVLDAPEPVAEPDPASGCVAVPDAPHHLRVRGLVVQRPGAAAPALDGVDLDLPPGHRVAVVGASGAGKSTLAAVLLRFVPYQAGSVTLDGVELAAAQGDAVRAVVGLAGQDAHVFDTTIRENLRLAATDPTDDELWSALSAARLAAWVRTLPLGLDTHVGQHGAQISGGQRQRLSLARALLADFPVLILDEPGEHLDTETADALTADLLEVTEGRSTVLVTHRLTGLDAVDEIVLLDHGRVAERGTHTELLAAGGAYAGLWSAEQEQD